MDLNTGLTQALSDGTNTYLYGNGRIAQYDSTAAEYFLTDALGSVRQLTNASGAVTMAKSYDPYGVVTQSAGNAQTDYGYTGEMTDSAGLVYLRARHYAPAMGRFLSRDTWGGDVNRPLSFNRWGYVEGNPINLSDPTGMRPGEDHYKYCEYLTGEDWKYCNRIVRGFDPADETITDYLWKIYDFGNCQNLETLDKFLPHSVYRGTWKEYGWWWHYLLDETPGWWNNEGKSHIYFRDVVAFALGVELSIKGSDAVLIGYAAGAFATKASAPDQGFYRFIGSRQSVFERVNIALYGNPKRGSYDIGNRSKFNPSQDELGYHIQTRYGGSNNWGEKILRRSGFTEDQRLGWEWGNPLDGFEDVAELDGFKAALNADSMGSGIDQVLFRDRKFEDRKLGGKPPVIDGKYYSLFFIISQAQEHNLCGGKTCVRNTP